MLWWVYINTTIEFQFIIPWRCMRFISIQKLYTEIMASEFTPSLLWQRQINCTFSYSLYCIVNSFDRISEMDWSEFDKKDAECWNSLSVWIQGYVSVMNNIKSLIFSLNYFLILFLNFSLERYKFSHKVFLNSNHRGKDFLPR